MTLAEQLEEYRRNRIRQFEYEKLNRTTKLRQLQEENAALEAAQSAAEGAIFRAKLPLPSGDICPRCWIDEGAQRRLVATSPDTETPPNQDIMRCPSSQCRWEIAIHG
jgi:hypothetical protein